jgi:hypothetical protein
MGVSRDDASWVDIVWWSFVMTFEEGYSREHKWENPKNVTACVSVWLTWQANLFSNERIK